MKRPLTSEHQLTSERPRSGLTSVSTQTRRTSQTHKPDEQARRTSQTHKPDARKFSFVERSEVQR